MSTSSNHCQKVKSSCKIFANSEKTMVQIRKDCLSKLSNEILQSRKEKELSSNNNTWIEWDEENWHYTGEGFEGPEDIKKERVALYILVLDAINFCFWPTLKKSNDNNNNDTSTNPFEYEHLAQGLKKMAELDDKENNNCLDTSSSFVFAPTNLIQLTPESFQNLLQPHIGSLFLYNIEKRCQLLNEVGSVLIQDFNGSVMTLLQQANGHGPTLVDLIATHFTGFQDKVEYIGDNDDTVWFLKRAQIFVGDINAALQLNLTGMNELTTFADYRVPQILRHYGILEYNNELTTIVDAQQEIKPGSIEEVSIRSATVLGVEELVSYLNNNAMNNDNNNDPVVLSSTTTPLLFTAVSVDWYLWQAGEKMNQQGQLKPFHRVRTHFY